MPASGPRPAPKASLSRAIAGALGAFLFALVAFAGFAHAQQPAPATPAIATRAASQRSAASAPKPVVRQATITHPTWAELSPAQRQSLTPLAGTWDTVSEAQKRKWIALALNFQKLAPAEQVKLHSRMTEWVALTPQQRTQARLNFGETKALAPDDKKAKWEAYQALPPEEKRQLAAGAAKPLPTAAAVRPVSPDKLAAVPKVARKPEVRAPRIAVAPLQGDAVNPLASPPVPAPSVPN